MSSSVATNLAAHKRAGVQAVIRAAGANSFYLPHYSPDLNPIKLAFAKPKALLRKAAAGMRDALRDTIGRLIDAFAPPTSWL